MKYFNIQVYDCCSCPSADHYNECCDEYLNTRERYIPTVEDHEVAKRIYEDNVHGLCDSCPRLQ